MFTSRRNRVSRLSVAFAVVALFAVLIGLGIGGIASPSSTPANAAGTDEQGQTFQVHESQTSFVSEDPAGKTHPGALFMIHSVLKTVDGPQVVGALDFMCTVLTAPPNAVFHCEGTATFSAGGTIEFAGVGHEAQLDFTVSVTGGTGPFIGSEGQLFFHSVNSSGTENLDTFTLSG